MTALLEIRAGDYAYRHIQKNGLHADDISYVFGASGAAKWLAIYGLDRAIFSRWLNHATKPIELFGTSVGAFKLAAACHGEPAAALERLANAYVDQNYTDKDFSADRINVETLKILETVANVNGRNEILEHPILRFHCGAVRTQGSLAKNKSFRQKLALGKIFIDVFGGRKHYGKKMQRIVFHHPESKKVFSGADGIITHQTVLNKDNLQDALLASGSIPNLMHGVNDISGAPSGLYFDGGVLDYHPLPSYLGADKGLTLYPHFYPHLIPGWFDKHFKSRYATSKQLDKVIMLSPSALMIEQLAGGKIPDRKDFVTLQNNNQKRKDQWHQCMDLSLALGEEFLEMIQSGNIVEKLQRL